MKRVKHNTLLVTLLGILLLLGACKKDTKLEETGDGILDANVSFITKPEPGTEFFLHLYHTQEEDEPFYQRDPDVVLRRTLSESDIENGFTLLLEELDRSGFAYVTAFVDLDGNGEISEGDIATGYYEHNFRAVLRGKEKASNVAHRAFLTIEMEEIYTSFVPFGVDFTFTFVPGEGTELFLNLYYAEQEEPKFYEREPDDVRSLKLEGNHIGNGAEITLDDMQDSPYVYVMAYLDINGNGELDHGDVATVYDGVSLMDVIAGEKTASAVGDEDRIEIDMKEDWFIQESDVLRDIDGNEYKTVVIGALEWVVENLKTTRFRNGALIKGGLSDAEWENTFNAGRVPAYAVYPYTESGGTVSSEAEMIAKYGFLYNGYVADNPWGACPVGWRVASDDDFKALEQAAGMPESLLDETNWRGTASLSPNAALKLRSTEDWPLVGTDDLGFKAVPTGVRLATGAYANFINAGTLARAVFWTSTKGNDTGTLGYRRMFESSRPHSILRTAIAKREGYCIRCVRDVN